MSKDHRIWDCDELSYVTVNVLQVFQSYGSLRIKNDTMLVSHLRAYIRDA
jgi:hypothetical protein